MTLVLTIGISGFFSAMTTDHRRIEVDYVPDSETGEMVIDPKTIVVCEEKDTKAHRLNDKVLIGAGGRLEISDFLIRTLQEVVKEEHDLSDCKVLLETIISTAKSRIDEFDYLNLLNEPNRVSVSLTGFYRDGSSGLIWFSSGKDSEVLEFKASFGQSYYGIIAPGKEYDRQIESFFSFPELTDLYNQVNAGELSLLELKNKAWEIVQERLINIHGVISYTEPLKVSPDFEIHKMDLNQDKIRYQVQKHDLSGQHSHYEKLEKETRLI
jgi:hypothetical protein